MVQAPSRFTLAAQEVRRLRSRSVAVMVRRSLAASNKKLERIGIVVLRSTTPWVAVSSLSSSNLLTLISIAVPWIAPVASAAIVSTSAGDRGSDARPFLLLLLISNQKHIKPVVTAGNAEKWKFDEKPHHWRACEHFYRCTKSLTSDCGSACANRDRNFRSAPSSTRSTRHPQARLEKTSVKSEKPRSRRGS